MNKLTLSFMIMVFFTVTCFATVPNMYQFPTKEQHQRFEKLTFELRCVVCQNQNLAESEAPIAGDLRHEISNMIKQGQTNKQIIQYLVHRYGDFILYNPPVVQKTWLLWFGPFVLLLFGFVLLLARIIYQRKHLTNKNLDVKQQQRAQHLLEDN